MASSETSGSAIVEAIGVAATVIVGRVAAKGTQRTGIKTKKKYECEIVRGSEFNVEGQLMRKERIIDRKNDYYRELVVNTDTGEIVRDIEQPLSLHTDRGSAKFKK